MKYNKAKASLERLLAGESVAGIGSLSTAQAIAVSEGFGPLLLLAGAGSGKTRVMAMRIAHSVLIRGAKINALMPCSFTKSSAQELKSRIFAWFNLQVKVSTIHSFSNQLIREWSGKETLILSEGEALSLIRAVCQALRVEDNKPEELLAAISSAKNRGMTTQSFSPFSGLRESIAEIFPAVWHAYERLKESKGRLDFDDLILHSLSILRSEPEILKLWHDRYKHIFVDEFQDTAPLQWQLIRSVYEGRFVEDPFQVCQWEDSERSLTVVGDADQAIYAFRQSSQEIILRFHNQYPHARRVHLGENYRSTETIVEAAAVVIANNRQRLAKRDSAIRKGGKKIRLAAFKHLRYEGYYIAYRAMEAIRQMENRDITLGLLARRNAQLAEIQWYLIEKGISVRSREIPPLEHLTEIQRLKDLFSAAICPRDNHRLARSARHFFNPGNLASLKQAARRARVSIWDAVCNQQDEEAITFRRALLETHCALSEQRKLWGLAQACDSSGWIREIFSGEKEDQLPRLVEFFNRIEVASQRMNADMVFKFPTIDLMTIHGSKGLERNVIFLCGVEEGIFPDETSDIEEERRLFYVAMTRAQDELVITCPLGKPSRFMSEVPPEWVEYDSGGIAAINRAEAQPEEL
jgi:DNA helicase-2/ATP-dependent DNA helicase PcrA